MPSSHFVWRHNVLLSVGVVEGGEAGVEPVEEGLLEEALPEQVNDNTHEVDAHTRGDGMEPQQIAGELGLNGKDIVPKPCTQVAVGVDEQDAKGGCGCKVDHAVVPHVDILEHQE